jgi:hypothetical protein
MKRIFFIVTIIIIRQVSLLAEDFIYCETVGKEEIKVIFSLIKNHDNTVSITIKKNEVLNKLLCNDNYSIIKWEFSNPQKKISANAKRKDNSIILNMMHDGKEKTATIIVDENPWYYPLDFCLGQFAVSGQKEINFWMIDPMGGAKQMQAIREGEEILKTENYSIESIKIIIKVKAISTIFWKAEACYRKKDGLLIKFIGKKGGPVNPVTTVLLDEKTLQ